MSLDFVHRSHDAQGAVLGVLRKSAEVLLACNSSHLYSLSLEHPIFAECLLIKLKLIKLIVQ